MKKIAEANVSNDGDYESLPEAWYPLQIEHAEYMEDRNERIAEERKAKKAEKAARNKQHAADYAESKSA